MKKRRRIIFSSGNYGKRSAPNAAQYKSLSLSFELDIIYSSLKGSLIKRRPRRGNKMNLRRDDEKVLKRAALESRGSDHIPIYISIRSFVDCAGNRTLPATNSIHRILS